MTNSKRWQGRGPGVLRISRDRGDQRIFFGGGFEIFDLGIFLGWKIGFFGGIQNILKIRNNSHVSLLHSSANKILWLRNSAWDFWGVKVWSGDFFGVFFWVFFFPSFRSSLPLEILSTRPPPPGGADHQSLCFTSYLFCHSLICLCQCCLVFLNANYVFLFVMELENVKSRASRQKNNCVTQALFQKLKHQNEF